MIVHHRGVPTVLLVVLLYWNPAWNMSVVIRHWMAVVVFDSVSWDPRLWHCFKIFLYIPRKTFTALVGMLVLFKPLLSLLVGFPVESSPEVRLPFIDCNIAAGTIQFFCGKRTIYVSIQSNRVHIFSRNNLELLTVPFSGLFLLDVGQKNTRYLLLDGAQASHFVCSSTSSLNPPGTLQFWLSRAEI